MNELTVKCKTVTEGEPCPAYLLIGGSGVQRTGESYYFPFLTGAWQQDLGCPDCKQVHSYSHKDVRDANGFPV
jgi:hypothetical protein